MSERNKLDSGTRDSIAREEDTFDGVTEGDAERAALGEARAVARCALRQLAAGDPHVRAVIEAHIHGAWSRAEVMRRTGLSLLQYRTALGQLDRLIARFSPKTYPVKNKESHA